jgi:hypothetical protein
LLLEASCSPAHASSKCPAHVVGSNPIGRFSFVFYSFFLLFLLFREILKNC